ncbi:MAG TPA: hypothetical protein VFR67_01380 [Pilimelia sp.]|nr:hypothetical protein [Pilimelia sp.]
MAVHVETVRPYACAIDANPYGFLANLANAAQVGLVARLGRRVRRRPRPPAGR